MVTRLARSIRDWFTGDARLRRQLDHAGDRLAYFREALARERRRAEELERQLREERKAADALRIERNDLARRIADLLDETDVLRAMGLVPLPPEVPAQPIAEHGGEVRP